LEADQERQAIWPFDKKEDNDLNILDPNDFPEEIDKLINDMASYAVNLPEIEKQKLTMEKLLGKFAPNLLNKAV
jgi:hypothetical protein